MLDFPSLKLDNSYERELEGFYVSCQGDKAPDPQVLLLNTDLANQLGLDAEMLKSPQGAALLSGGGGLCGTSPLAMAYAGHQFGGFAPLLGDGRATLIGEVIDTNGDRQDIHLKGSGRTPFSRGGDGKAALGPVLREFLVAEAMHKLGIPTTRALSATLTGETIQRVGSNKGAVLARVASSHIRVGTFQFFASIGDTEKVQQLLDYAIDRHYPDISKQTQPNSLEQIFELLTRVRDKHAALVAKWMHVGFIHGVMNTDNTTISGETIDYGPCAFMDHYDPKTVFSSIDHFGRYAYGNQPAIAQWNLARLAEALLSLVKPEIRSDAVKTITQILDGFTAQYHHEWLNGMRAKLGLVEKHPIDDELANSLFEAMNEQDVDFTKFFRSLATAVRGDTKPVFALFNDPTKDFTNWFDRFAVRGKIEGRERPERAAQMDSVNPVYIPRNHKVEEVLAAAETGDMGPFNRLHTALSAPYSAQSKFDDLSEPAPESFGIHQTFCGT